MALQLWKKEEANQETGKRELLCSFGYNTQQNLPLRKSLDMDHWGYYNGPNSSNGSLFPAHTVLGHAIPGADLTPHWPCTSANMLTSVTYKGGGKKEFEYEPNRLTSGEIIGGVRIKEIREYASATVPVSVTRYEYLEGEACDTDIYYTSVDTESPYLANTFVSPARVSMRCSIRTDRRSSIRWSKRFFRTAPTRFTGTRLSPSIRIPYRRYTRPTLPA